MLNPISLLEKGILRILKLFESKKLQIGHSAKWSQEKSRKSKGGWKIGKEFISMEDTFKGAIILGGSGSGKTINAIIPSILHSKGSLVIHDPSFELLLKTGAQLQKQGYDIYSFNPNAVNLSTSFNPLAQVGDAQDANLTANRLVSLLYPKDNGDTFWKSNAESLVSMCISILLDQGRKHLNLPNLFHLINQFESNIKVLTSIVKSLDNPLLWGNFLSFMNSDDKVKSGVIATAKSCIGYLNDPKIGRVLGSNQISSGLLRNKKTAIFIQTGTATQKYFYLLTSLLFENLFGDLLSKLPNESDLPIHFILDEAASLSCPMLSQAMANLRKYRVGIMLSLQDYSQLVERYGENEAKTIRTNSYTQVVLPGSNFETGKYYEDLLGKVESNGRTSPLISSDRLRRLPKNNALFIQSNSEAKIISMEKFKKVKNEIPEIKRDPTLVCPPTPLLDYSHFNYD